MRSEMTRRRPGYGGCTSRAAGEEGEVDFDWTDQERAFRAELVSLYPGEHPPRMDPPRARHAGAGGP